MSESPPKTPTKKINISPIVSPITPLVYNTIADGDIDFPRSGRVHEQDGLPIPVMEDQEETREHDAAAIQEVLDEIERNKLERHQRIINKILQLIDNEEYEQCINYININNEAQEIYKYNNLFKEVLNKKINKRLLQEEETNDEKSKSEETNNEKKSKSEETKKKKPRTKKGGKKSKSKKNKRLVKTKRKK